MLPRDPRLPDRARERPEVTTLAHALNQFMALVEALPAEDASLENARGRFALGDVLADHDIPPFDASAVDGFAVRALDLLTARDDAPVSLPVRGESRAGLRWHAELEPGAVMRSFVGSRIPPGADAVATDDQVQVALDRASFARPLEPGAGIRLRASDLARGEVLLAGGTRLDAAALGLLASQGRTSVRARCRPRIAIVSMVDDRTTAGDAASRQPTASAAVSVLRAQIESAGGVPVAMTQGQGVDPMASLLGHAFSAADAVVVLGGASGPQRDDLGVALGRLGVASALLDVRMRPGGLLVIGAKDRIPVLGLAGDLLSAWMTFEIFVRPAIRRMLGDPRPYRALVEVELGKRAKPSQGFVLFARARIEYRGGEVHARPVAKQSPFASAVECDALLVLPEREAPLEIGERCDALLLSGSGSARLPFH